MDSVSVHIENIAMTYHEQNSSVQALKGVDLAIGPGEFFVLLGPSGCGKTTLLKVIAGLLEPEQGRIRVDDTTIFDAEDGINIRPMDREVSFVFQNIALYPHMTVKKNLEFPLKVRHRMEKQEREQVVQGIASFLQIDGLLNRYPRHLSGGQLQRVAIGRAMVRDPKLFLMDEPMSNLDAELRRGIRTYFKNLQRKIGTTTIYVTHDQKEAMSLADRLAVVIDGTVQQVGTPQDVYEHPETLEVANFMGESPMNVFEGELVSVEDTYYFLTDYARFQVDQSLAWKLRRTGRKECLLGIRPEFIRLAPEGKGNVDARISFTQETGPTRMLYASLGNRKPVMIELRSIDDDDMMSVREERVGLSFEPEKLNVFTTAGNRIEI